MLNGNGSCVQTFRLLTLPDSLLSNYKALFRIAEVNRPAAARTLFVWFGVAKGKHSESWQPQAMQGQGSGWLVGFEKSRWEGREGKRTAASAAQGWEAGWGGLCSSSMSSSGLVSLLKAEQDKNLQKAKSSASISTGARFLPCDWTWASHPKEEQCL